MLTFAYLARQLCGNEVRRLVASIRPCSCCFMERPMLMQHVVSEVANYHLPDVGLEALSGLCAGKVPYPPLHDKGTANPLLAKTR